MVITEVSQDLFSIPQGYYLAHCISGDYAFEAGIAAELDKRYDMRLKLHERFSIPAGKRFANVGRALLVDNVFNLVVKERYFHKPELETIFAALLDMRARCDNNGIRFLAMPLISYGPDGPDWEHIRGLFEVVFADADIQILVCRERK